MLLGLSARAQTASVGRVLYEKLADTRKEYQRAMATGDSLNVAETCYLMGKRYTGLGDYVTADKWFLRSLRIREPRGPSEDIGKVYLRMAENQTTQKHYAEAMALTRRAISNFQHARSKHGMKSAHIVMAGVYYLAWELNSDRPGTIPITTVAAWDSSLYHYRRAEQLALTLNIPYDLAHIYQCLGNALSPKYPEQAIVYLKKANNINKQEKLPYPAINVLQRLAACYLRLKQPLAAKKCLDRAITIRDSTHYGDHWQNRNLEESYVQYYRQTGQWQQALAHQDAYYAYYIAALEADRVGTIERSELLYENEKKEIALNAQQAELKLRRENLKAQQQLTLLTTLLFFITSVGCLVLYWLFRKYQRISRHNAKLVKEQNHRVKNNLQSITNLLGLQFNQLTDERAKQAVEESLLRVEAMALVHQRLYDGERLVEVDLTQYIPELVEGVLRSFSFGQVQLDYAIEPIWLDADMAINVGLLLNELVTNSCKYAFPAHPNPCLSVGCQEKNGRIHLYYSDNGPGFKPFLINRSFGMKLIEMITEKLKGNGRFSTDQGVQFTLSFDLKTVLLAS